jgi:hypothetical protein
VSDSARIARKLALATARTRRWRRRQRNGVVSLRIVVPEEVALTLAEDGLLDAHLDDDPGALAAAIERLISVGAGAEGNVSGRLQKSKFAPRRNCFREGRHRHQKGPAVQVREAGHCLAAKRHPASPHGGARSCIVWLGFWFYPTEDFI